MKIVFHERYFNSSYATDPAASEGRLDGIMALIKSKPERYEIITPNTANEADILRAHGRNHLESIKRDPLLYELASLAAGALAAVRPPGHHAERAMAMGFCYFNNVAVTAEQLLASKAAERIAIVDYDVHHGNGTQHIFENRAEVLYVSTHQYPFYPGTGAAEERGRGAGEGTTLNIPLPAGCGDEEYRFAFQERLLPALHEFAPAILLVSAGFDSWRGDPVG